MSQAAKLQKRIDERKQARREDLAEARAERISSQMSDLTQSDYIPNTQDSMISMDSIDSMGSSYTRGTFGRGSHKYIRPRKYTKKSYHKKMPKKSYKRRSSRKSSNPYYYDRVLEAKVVKPSVGRRWTKILADTATNPWKAFYQPVNTVEEAGKLPFGLDSKSATDAQLLMRKTHGYRGSGSYGKMWRKSGLGKTMAGAGRSLIKAGVSKFLGQGLYGGQGLYSGNSNVLDNALIEGGHMSMDILGNNDETETITITNCESIKEIFAPNIAPGSSSQYAAETIEVNPGLFQFSRKLSAIAKNYVQYEIKQLVFEIRPLISDSNVNNGITGTLMAGVMYDPVGETPDNKDDLMDLSGSRSGRIIDQINVGVECDPLKTKDSEYFVRTGPVPSGRDIDEYDHCKFVVATNNIPDTFSNRAIAELYVYYTVELRMWKNNRDILRDYFTLHSSAVARTEATTPSANFSNSEVIRAQQSNLGCLVTGTNPSNSPTWTITFPADFSGCVEIKLFVEGASMAVNNATISQAGNCSQLFDMFGAATLAGDAPSSSIVATLPGQIILTCHYRVKSATGAVNNTVTIALTGPAYTGTVGQWALDISEYSGQFFQSRNNPVPLFTNIANGIAQAAA